MSPSVMQAWETRLPGRATVLGEDHQAAEIE